METSDRPMVGFDPGLRKGQVLSNEELTDLFKCGSAGGMRCSFATSSIILITGDSVGPYRDRWEGEEFHFTGRGPTGDQDLGEGPNHALAESNETDTAVFHFDTPDGERYIYTGRVKLAGEPYTEPQPDETGAERTVWMFPLSVIRSQRELEWRAGQKAAAEEFKRRSGMWPRFVDWVKDTVRVRE